MLLDDPQREEFCKHLKNREIYILSTFSNFHTMVSICTEDKTYQFRPILILSSANHVVDLV